MVGGCRGPETEIEVKVGRQGDREAGPVEGQWGHGGAHTQTHTRAHRHAHGPRLEPKLWGHTRSQAQPPSPPGPSLPAHLLGLGRGLGREAGAGTFRDPAVSVIRAHQLGRQASTWAFRAPTPCARASHPHLVPGTQRPGPPPPPACGLKPRLLLPLRHGLRHQLVDLGLLVPGKNDVEGFVVWGGKSGSEPGSPLEGGALSAPGLNPYPVSPPATTRSALLQPSFSFAHI